MKASVLSFCLACCFVLSAPAVHAGAWTKEKGDGEVIFTTAYFTSDSFFDRDGDKQKQPRFRKLELNTYLEYGYSDRLTLGASFATQWVQQEEFTTFNTGPNTTLTLNYARNNYGIGNPELFARYNLWETQDKVLAIEPLLKLPSLYYYDGVPRSGSDSFDTGLAVLGGHSFEWQGQWHYAEARLGYRHRFDSDLDDQLHADVKMGLRINRDWEIIPALYSTWALGGKNTIFTEDGQNDYDLVKLEAMLRYNFSRDIYLQAGGFSHVYGRNVGDGSGLMITTGVYF